MIKLKKMKKFELVSCNTSLEKLVLNNCGSFIQLDAIEKNEIENIKLPKLEILILRLNNFTHNYTKILDKINKIASNSEELKINEDGRTTLKVMNLKKLEKLTLKI